jgi:hypothetical protein
VGEAALGRLQGILRGGPCLDGLERLVPGRAQLGRAPLDPFLELLVETLQLEVRLVELPLLLLGDGLGLLARLPLPIQALFQTLDVVHVVGSGTMPCWGAASRGPQNSPRIAGKRGFAIRRRPDCQG